MTVPLIARAKPEPPNIFLKNLSPKTPYNIRNNLPYYYFASGSIVLKTPSINKLEPGKYFTIFMLSCISSFKITIVMVVELNIFP